MGASLVKVITWQNCGISCFPFTYVVHTWNKKYVEYHFILCRHIVVAVKALLGPPFTYYSVVALVPLPPLPLLLLRAQARTISTASLLDYLGVWLSSIQCQAWPTQVGLSQCSFYSYLHAVKIAAAADCRLGCCPGRPCPSPQPLLLTCLRPHHP